MFSIKWNHVRLNLYYDLLKMFADSFLSIKFNNLKLIFIFRHLYLTLSRNVLKKVPYKLYSKWDLTPASNFWSSERFDINKFLFTFVFIWSENIRILHSSVISVISINTVLIILVGNFAIKDYWHSYSVCMDFQIPKNTDCFSTVFLLNFISFVQKWFQWNFDIFPRNCYLKITNTK